MAAGVAENEGVDLDRKNQRSAAVAKYEECVRELDAAIAAALPHHSEDRPKLIEHKAQVEARIATLKASPTTAIPVEDQIKSVQLAMAGASQANAAGAAYVATRQDAVGGAARAAGGAALSGV